MFSVHYRMHVLRGTAGRPAAYAARSVKMLLTFVHGAGDDKFARLASKAVAVAPSADSVAIAGAGHNPVLEAPSQMRHLIAQLQATERE